MRTVDFLLTVWRSGNKVRAPLGWYFIGVQCEKPLDPARSGGFAFLMGVAVVDGPPGSAHAGGKQLQGEHYRDHRAMQKQRIRIATSCFSAGVSARILVSVATKKTGNVSFRTNAALKEAFEKALGKHPEFNGPTAFYEDAMRSLVLATRQKRQLAIPLEFLSREGGQ